MYRRFVFSRTIGFALRILELTRSLVKGAEPFPITSAPCDLAASHATSSDDSRKATVRSDTGQIRMG